MKRGRIGAVTTLLLALAVSLPLSQALAQNAPAQVIPFIQLASRSDDSMMLCAVVLDKEILSEDMTAYVTPVGVFLPLGELSRVIEFGVDVQPRDGKASGFLADPSKQFALDMVKGEATAAGKTLRYDRSLVEAHADDIYVESGLLGEWLALRLDVDLNGAQITVRPSAPLPMQLRVDRLKRWAGLRRQSASDSEYPIAPNPYRLLDGFCLDQSLAWRTSVKDSGESSGSIRFSSLLTGDIGYMGGTLYLSGTSDNSSAKARLSLNRSDTDGRILGPLGVRSLTMGLVSLPVESLLPFKGGETGVMVSSYPLGTPDVFDAHTFDGSLLPGWSVELYRDDELIDYRTSGDDERYTFTDVPLYLGANRFRLVFSGPHGEERVEVHDLNVGRDMTRPGQLLYEAAMVDTDAGDGSYLRSSLGLSESLTLYGTLATACGHSYAGLGTHGYHGNWGTSAQILSDVDSGELGGELTAQTRFSGLGLNVRAMYTDIHNEDDSGGLSAVRSRLSASLSGIRPFGSDLRSPRVTLDYMWKQLWTGGEGSRLSVTWSQPRRGLNITNRLSLTDGPEVFGDSTGELSARTTASMRVNRMTLRGEADYDLVPSLSLRAVSSSLEFALPDDYRFMTTVAYDELADTSEVYATLSRSSGACAVSLTGGYSNTQGTSMEMSLSTSISREPRTKRLVADARPHALYGAVSVRVFLDMNRDGVRGADEPLLKGVRIMANGRGRSIATNDQGIAFLRDLTDNEPVVITIVDAGLEDPLWIPGLAGVKCVPRHGSALAADLPVYTTGEISGVIHTVDASGERAIAAHVGAELLDSAGKVVAKTRSGFDGYYTFTGIAPGEYSIRAAGDGSPAGTTTAKSVRVPAAGQYIDGVDLLINETAPGSGNQ